MVHGRPRKPELQQLTCIRQETAWSRGGSPQQQLLMPDQPVLCCVVGIPHQQLGWLFGLRQRRWRGQLLLRKLSTLCRSCALRLRNRSGGGMGGSAASCCTMSQSREDCMHFFWIGRAVEIQEAVDKIIHSDLTLRKDGKRSDQRARQLPVC